MAASGAVDLEINPNTVMRAYRELELGGLLETHQGTGTFIAVKKLEKNSTERERQLSQMAGECAARAGAAGFTVEAPPSLHRLEESMRTGLYPGSFDPIHNGHLDIIGRAVKLVDKLVIGVALDTGKAPMFSLEERVEILREETQHLQSQAEIVVHSYQGLTINAAR